MLNPFPDRPPPGFVLYQDGRPYVYSPTDCGACGAPVYIPVEGMEPGGLVICTRCAHVLTVDVGDVGDCPVWYARNLTPAEAEVVAAHPNFMTIRAQQERMAGELGLFG